MLFVVPDEAPDAALPEVELEAVVADVFVAGEVEPAPLVDPESELLAAALPLPLPFPLPSPLPLAVSAPEEVVSEPASAAVLPTAASLVLLVPPELLRKSVTYQPEPLS